jgi:hypothetical protein
MATLRHQLFKEFAQMGLSETLTEYRKKFQIKKGERFNNKGITYEIGPAIVGQSGIEFEISSKIPQDELTKSMTLDSYFKEVRKIMERKGKKPFAIDKENIVREMGGDEVKERDYVKLKYMYEELELFDTGEIAEQATSIAEKDAQSLPEVPGVQTVAGRLVLLSVRDSLKSAAKENMDFLIDANEQVRKKIKKPRKKT